MPSKSTIDYPHGSDHGLPPRPPTASTALWAHLLQPNAQAPSNLSELSGVAPPSKPLDKNATSMRILLHDTQAHFEKFTIHAGKLLDGVKESQHEIKSIHTLFERDRETLMGDMIDLVNRSQREIQKSIGTPAQSPSVEAGFKDIMQRLNGVEQRLDTIQAFNQSHTQALQTQIQATQILLDKQGSILSTVLPLLPLIQTIPLHIDAAKTSIHESLTKILSSWKPTLDQIPSPAISTTTLHNIAQTTGKRKRSNSRCSTSSSSAFQPIGLPSHKKLRSDGSFSRPAFHVPQLSSKSGNQAQRDVEAYVLPPQDENTHLEREKDASSVSELSPVGGVEQTSTSSRIPDRTLTTPRSFTTTPRRPLLDLLIPLPSRQNSTPRNPTHHMPQEGHMTRSSTAEKGPPSGLVGMTPNASRPPRILRVQTSIANNVKRSGTAHSVADPASNKKNQSSHLRPKSSRNSFIPGRAISRANTSQFPSETHTEADRRHNSSFKLPAPNFAQDLTAKTCSSNEVAVTISNQAVTVQNDKKAPLELVLGKSNQRNTPVREGRRFIPLVDSEDEEEEIN